MVCLSPFIFSYQFLKAFLCPFGVLFTADPDPVSDPVDVSINSQARFAEGIEQNHIGCFSAHSGKA